MMKLVIGGTAQGKLEYVLLKHDVQKNMVWDGVLPNDRELNGNIVIINHLHQWIKNCMVSGGCPEDEIMSFWIAMRTVLLYVMRLAMGLFQ